MKKKGFKSIKSMILLGGFATITLICMIILSISSVLSYNAFKEQVQEDMHVIAKQVSEKLVSDIETTEKVVEELAINPMLFYGGGGYTKDEVVSFFEKRAKETGFSLFFTVNEKGKGVNLTQKSETFDVSDTEYFKHSIKGETYTSSIINDVVTGEKIIIISTPYYEPGTNKLAGVFAGIKSVDFISKMCADFKWGETGNIAVYDETTNVVGHTNADVLASGLNLIEKASTDKEYKSVAEFFKRAIDSKTDVVGTYDWFGKKRFGAICNIAERGYITLVAINEDEMFGHLNKLQFNLLLLIIGLTLLGVAMIYFTFARPLANVFKNLKTDLLNIANYDLSKESVKDYSRRKDEIGDIYDSTTTLKNNIVSIISNISSHAQNTAATAEELTATTQATTETANEVANAVSNIADGATSQAEDTQNATKNVENTNNLLSHTLAVLEELYKSTEFINEKKEEGSKTLEELLLATGRVSESSREIAEIIAQTDESAEKISSASDMIQSVSDQTNLLALNAAIEAARAGEAGKGFAVVAEEIRKLAEQTAGFTGDIKITITDLQEKTKKAVEAMEFAKEAVNEQEMKLDETGNKFNQITEALGKSQEIVNEVSQEAKAIVKGNEEITKVIESLSAIAEENAATTEEVSASVDIQVQSIQGISEASENLAEIATDLQTEVSKFII
ncbi:MAG: methyl-accepting chemotaxis protein [Catonella sp.]|uniref:methyl-accepting chemotaxis protein n=1 Tax=Catonella sp. TaxID=2382125 RepID=UPI003FA15E3A